MTTDAHTSEINPNGPAVLRRLVDDFLAGKSALETLETGAVALAAAWDADRAALAQAQAERDAAIGSELAWRRGFADCLKERDAATARAELSEKHAEKEKAERTHQQYRAERAENALSRCRVQALDQAAKIVEAYAGSYPTDMFPPDSNDRDSISGTALRRVLPMVAGAIRTVIAGPEGGER